MELEGKNRILSEMSLIDGLTKIGNHRTLMEHLQVEMTDAKRTGDPLSLALFDVDDFKSINDSQGHASGDQVLTDFASITKNNNRETDFSGRYGGDEFMVIFLNTTLSAARKISERIIEAIENSNSSRDQRPLSAAGWRSIRMKPSPNLFTRRI